MERIRTGWRWWYRYSSFKAQLIFDEIPRSNSRRKVHQGHVLATFDGFKCFRGLNYDHLAKRCVFHPIDDSNHR
jgi:hypothetical protein